MRLPRRVRGFSAEPPDRPVRVLIYFNEAAFPGGRLKRLHSAGRLKRLHSLHGASSCLSGGALRGNTTIVGGSRINLCPLSDISTNTVLNIRLPTTLKVGTRGHNTLFN
jgi:hypothetical protein